MNWTNPDEPFGKAWVSAVAQSHWEPILTKYANQVQELEYLTVQSNIRPAALCHVNTPELASFARKMKHLDLRCLPLESTTKSCRVAVGRSEYTLSQMEMYWGKDDKAIGELLGYPLCCTTFFHSLWVVKNERDTCLQMDKGEPYWASNNILMRNIGVRPVFHLPCSFHCEATKIVARQILQVAGDLWGLSSGFGCIYDVLNWPVKFSALHGVAEITTPVFKLRRATDYSSRERVVEFQGNYYPQYGASGNKFPFIGILRPIELKAEDTWTINGFGTRASMLQAHDVILTVLGDIIDKSRSIELVDIGCGNGGLLRRIVEEYPNVRATGIDQSAKAITAARKTLPAGHYLHGDVTRMEFDQTYDIGLISINRIEEAKRSGNEHFLRYLRRFFKTLVVYNYDVEPVKVEAVYHAEANDETKSASSSAGFVPDWPIEGG